MGQKMKEPWTGSQGGQEIARLRAGFEAKIETLQREMEGLKHPQVVLFSAVKQSGTQQHHHQQPDPQSRPPRVQP